MSSESFEPKAPLSPPGRGDHDTLIEGEEAPPPGVKTMAFVRWILLAGAGFLAIFTWWSYANAQIHGNSGSGQVAAKYHCPMHPQIVSAEPGECPICHMSLEPIEAKRSAPPPRAASTPTPGLVSHSGEGSAAGVANYYCPMHQDQRSDQPGRCPVCKMDFEVVPPNKGGELKFGPGASNSMAKKGAGSPSEAPAMKAPEGTSRRIPMPEGSGPGDAMKPSMGMAPVAPGSAPPGTAPISLTLDRIQSIGVRTALVGDGKSTQSLRVTAVVAPAEQGVAEVHVRSAGFVEKLLVNQTGIAVERQQALFAFYSPEIFQAESELLATHRWERPDNGNATSDSSRRKLELLGMSSKDIDQIVKSREPMRAIAIYAPQAGYITKKNLVAGSYVTPEMVLYEIQDLSQVYVVADVFQGDIGSLQKGATGRFIPTRRPDEAIDVHVDLIYPTLNAEARTTRVRMQVRNPKGRMLRPGEYGSVDFAIAARKVLTIPRDALVDTGLYTYVFVVESDGVYSPREVTLGEEQGEQTTVLSGVSPGDRVVSGATFLIDSESRLQASAAEVAMTTPSEPGKPSPTDGPSCQEIDRAKFPDKFIECQKCVQIHHGMGSMEMDCKHSISKPWN